MGYWSPLSVLQQLLPSAAHTLPQHWLNCAQEKACVPASPPQHTAPGAAQLSPQHSESLPQKNLVPCLLVQVFISLMHGEPPETAYLVPWLVSVQHLSWSATHVLPQQLEPDAHAKVFPRSFVQQVSPAFTHVSPQQDEPPTHEKCPPEPSQQALPPPKQMSPQQTSFGPHVKFTP